MPGEIRNLLVMICVISGCIVGLTIWNGGMASLTSYSGDTDLSYMNQTSATMAKINSMQAALGTNTQAGSTDFITLITNGAFQALNIIPQSLDIMTSLITDIATILHLPVWIFVLFTSIIGIISIFAIIKAIFKVEP